MDKSPEHDLDQILSVGIDAVLLAVNIIMPAMDQSIQEEYKGKTNPVTKIDRDAEALIISEIKRHFPHHSILAEESGKDTNDSDVLWVIDPLDGTTNFVHGYPAFSVSIGVLIQGIPTIGIVAEMPNIKLYTAIKGQGAFMEGKPISVSRTKRLIDSLLVTGFGYEHGESWHKNMALFKSFTDKTQGVRRLGAASVDICHLASGKVDGYWEYDLSPWDSAAGIVIAEEAGASITRIDGKPYSIYDKQILISNGKLHNEMLNLISESL
ncbi:MAG: inositol monophosphatase [Candidatus Marinimicrobia bacterium]|jgi:myo-inositol-1(or 4)-monophosphatase|nr:inositol monophosphatase [Candidatus Neomarinimicrobiota bacterium]MBT3496390.1 inositol monophosphatase [Candidatus Neomarinimicrobiota bacterium]MBT3691782.1 inositol monophosphatase [Candidatus Neomarinimicrobiota bacterium]MBT3732167.1 inositol monophosphatase [Candidatus Neomarinimicrobiota bacterium]MBT4144351.1 inositol monophosphatase [Candidatus Neomarinimicrobiota bacterium]